MGSLRKASEQPHKAGRYYYHHFSDGDTAEIQMATHKSLPTESMAEVRFELVGREDTNTHFLPYSFSQIIQHKLHVAAWQCNCSI